MNRTSPPELVWGCPKNESREEDAGGSVNVAVCPARSIREVVLCLFLADGSLEIFESRQVTVVTQRHQPSCPNVANGRKAPTIQRTRFFFVCALVSSHPLPVA